MNGKIFCPLVSIIIPVYNGSNYLADAIESALLQTYKKTEIIVVNDGSTDGDKTEKIALSYGDRLRYFRKKNGGVASALNLGILEMRGDYFSWLSHDDLYCPEKIQRQVEFISGLMNRDVVVYSDYVNVDKDNNDLYTVCMDHQLLSSKPLYAVFRGALHGCTLLVPRSAFVNSGIFNDLRFTQDYDLWFRMIRRHEFLHMPGIFVRSRLHPEQGSRSIDSTTEANELWIRMMHSLTQEEILSLENSEAEFFSGMVRFLSETPYFDALQYAQVRAGCDQATNQLYNYSMSGGRNMRHLCKKYVKSFLLDIGMWGQIQKFRRKKNLHGGGGSIMESDENRVAETFVRISKVLQDVVASNK